MLWSHDCLIFIMGISLPLYWNGRQDVWGMNSVTSFCEYQWARLLEKLYQRIIYLSLRWIRAPFVLTKHLVRRIYECLAPRVLARYPSRHVHVTPDNHDRRSGYIRLIFKNGFDICQRIWSAATHRILIYSLYTKISHNGAVLPGVASHGYEIS